MNKPAQVKNVLTARQTQCAKHLLEGKTAKEIAAILNLSNRTIEYYIDNLKAKLNCKNRTQLILAVACLMQQLEFHTDNAENQP